MQTLAPIPVEEKMPHRKVIRSWLIPLSSRTTLRALVLLALDYALLLLALYGTVMLAAIWAKVVCGMAAGFVIGRLFIIGHDACHQSLTPHRQLNKWVGRVAFLPSLTPYSLWEVGHNVVHHGFTNLKGVDFVWAPLTPSEYAALSLIDKIKQRIYRSGWAPGLYYLIEIWWNRMFFPNRHHIPTKRAHFTEDCLLALAAGLVWIGAVVALSRATDQSLGSLLLTSFAIPFLFWNFMIGFVVYVHHTHISVTWFKDKTAWMRSDPFVSTTVHLTFPLRIGALMHHIMEHTAHHVDMSIPLYKLKQAQAMLEHMLPKRIVVQAFSWRWYFDTAKRCKLFDLDRACWTDFRGRATHVPAKLSAAA